VEFSTLAGVSAMPRKHPACGVSMIADCLSTTNH